MTNHHWRLISSLHGVEDRAVGHHDEERIEFAYQLVVIFTVPYRFGFTAVCRTDSFGVSYVNKHEPICLKFSHGFQRQPWLWWSWRSEFKTSEGCWCRCLNVADSWWRWNYWAVTTNFLWPSIGSQLVKINSGVTIDMMSLQTWHDSGKERWCNDRCRSSKKRSRLIGNVTKRIKNEIDFKIEIGLQKNRKPKKIVHVSFSL